MRNFAQWTQEYPQRPVFMTEMWYNQAIWMAEDAKHERKIFKYPEGVNTTSFPPQHALTMVREPTAHVVSQYFHCTESVTHRRKEFMPDTLLEWLVGWQNITRNSEQHYQEVIQKRRKWQEARKRLKAYKRQEARRKLQELPPEEDGGQHQQQQPDVLDGSQGTQQEPEQLLQTRKAQRHRMHKQWSRYFEHWRDPTFKCYNPVNLQGYLMGYARHADNPHHYLGVENDPKHYNSSFSSPNPNGFHVVTKQELVQRFDAIGLVSQFDLSYCLFMTLIQDGEVPPQCNCTNTTSLPTRTSTSTTQTVVTKQEEQRRRLEEMADVETANVIQPRDNSKRILTAEQKQRRKEMHAAREKARREGGNFDHGVKHHGSSYVLSTLERELIYDLTRLDHLIYELAVELFDEKVQEVERQYQVQLCRKVKPINGTAGSLRHRRRRRRKAGGAILPGSVVVIPPRPVNAENSSKVGAAVEGT